MNKTKNVFFELRKKISREKRILEELESLLSNPENIDSDEKRAVISHIEKLKSNLKEENENLPNLLNQISMTQKMGNQKDFIQKQEKKKIISKKKESDFLEKKPKKKRKLTQEELKEKNKVDRDALELEKEVFRRLEEKGKKAKKQKKNGNHPGAFAKLSNNLFSGISQSLSQKNFFQPIKRDLLKTNLNLVPTAYISMIIASTIISFIFALFVFLFLLFIEVGSLPQIVLVNNIPMRFLQTFWILIVIPLGVLTFMNVYPSLERRSLEQKINQELPFATINMSSIAGSMVEPTNIFKIIISTTEYPNLRKELIKLMNQINIYGYDLVTALKSSTINSPSKKLSELYNGLATTITSGGDLSNFFSKRSESLLLDYRLEREKYTKTAETFIDIYISVVIAAPMILMLLFMMIQISGLGISLEPSTLTLIMIIGLTVINFVFIMFLQLRQPSQ